MTVRRRSPRWRAVLCASILGVVVAAAVVGQWGRRWAPPRYPDRSHNEGFVFCRAEYSQVRNEWLGHGWNTDYPDSDSNFSRRLGELTTVTIESEPTGQPKHVVVRLTDDELFDHPFLFMSDVGTAGFSAREAANLRKYLLAGGFLYVDDFWGDHAWYHWERQIGTVLDPELYPVVDIPLDHPVFRSFFTVTEVPQIPSIQHWGWSGETSERGGETDEAHFRGIFDSDGRLMVAMTHNTDIADGWEREGESREFFVLFSLTKAYPLGINVALYSLMH